MDLLALLSQSAVGLAAHRGASATAAHNLQNANTPGYARQRAELHAAIAQRVGSAWIGRGVELAGVTQARDPFVEAQIATSFAQASAATAHATTLEGLSVLDPSSPLELSQALGDFYAQLRQLSQNPAQSGLRQSAVAGAQRLALAFNRTSEAIRAQREAADAAVSPLLKEVNALAAQVADLNRSIAIASTSAVAPNDLMDQRQAAVDRLAVLVGGQPVQTQGTDINVVLPGGVPLVIGDGAAALQATADPLNDGLLALSIVRSDGTGPMGLAQIGGEVGGRIAARDGALRTAAQSLDTLAFDFAGALNTVHAAGFALDGSTGRTLFDAGPAAAGAAGRFAVNAALLADPSLLGAASTAAGVPGDNLQLLALLGTESQALASGKDPAGTLTDLVSAFAVTAERMRAAATHELGVQSHLEALREATSGVSIDEEMLNLTRSQRAFEAVMKVIQTTDAMLETLLSIR